MYTSEIIIGWQFTDINIMMESDSDCNLQSFRKFLASGRFRCFKIKQIDLIREIQKMRAGCI